MNIELHNKLTTDGYLSFDLSTEIKEKLIPIAAKIKQIEFRNLRHTGCGNSDSTNDSFENLEKLKKEYAPLKKWQVWYQEHNLRNHITADEYNFLHEIFTNIIQDVYPIDSYSKQIFINCTMYNKLCYINNHQDGNNGNRLGNILIYLNDDYVDGMGGEIIINNNIKVNPDLGKVAILDFSNANPQHAVTEVLDETFRRISIIVELTQNNEK
jgi:Rps23 Pro-64 3,4-dihydroxylase Tpa1-like proline 4-hydroxylase